MTGSELRCRCYVTAYVRLSWQTNETECRDAWQKCLQSLIKQTTAGSSCLLKKEGPDRRLSLTELFNLKTVFFFGFICYCLNCNYHFDDHISIKFIHIVFHVSFFSPVKVNSTNWPSPNIWVFIAQMVEHCSANAEAMGSMKSRIFFFGFIHICNCLNYNYHCDDHNFM